MIMHHAWYLESGTGEARQVSSPTREGLETLIYGNAYAPVWGSVMVWYVPIPETRSASVAR